MTRERTENAPCAAALLNFSFIYLKTGKVAACIFFFFLLVVVARRGLLPLWLASSLV